MKPLEDLGPAVLDLEEAVARLEAGEWREEWSVALPGGAEARADGPAGSGGLLQRLKGYLKLMALDKGGAAACESAAPRVRADVKALLDAVKNAG